MSLEIKKEEADWEKAAREDFDRKMKEHQEKSRASSHRFKKGPFQEYNGSMEDKKLEFVECDTCRPKPGTPPLCWGCLHNRTVIEILKKNLPETLKVSVGEEVKNKDGLI